MNFRAQIRNSGVPAGALDVPARPEPGLPVDVAEWDVQEAAREMVRNGEALDQGGRVNPVAVIVAVSVVIWAVVIVAGSWFAAQAGWQ